MWAGQHLLHIERSDRLGVHREHGENYGTYFAHNIRAVDGKGAQKCQLVTEVNEVMRIIAKN